MTELDPDNAAPGAGALPAPPPTLDAPGVPAPDALPLSPHDPEAIRMAGEQLGNLVVMAIGAGFKMSGAKANTPERDKLLTDSSSRYAAARPELILKLMRWTPELDFFGTIIYVVTTAEMETPAPTTFGAPDAASSGPA